MQRLAPHIDVSNKRVGGVKSKLRYFDTAFKELLKYFGDKKGQPAETFEKVRGGVVRARRDPR